MSTRIEFLVQNRDMYNTEVYVRGRFAPTPSGHMHLGNAAAALVSWLDVRSQGATMVLRIEDLDPRGASKEHAKQLMEDMLWLGLDWDLGPIWQSERLDKYERALKQLQELDLIYPCFCSRADLHAASAPHASDGTPIYPKTCAHLSPQEVNRLRHTKVPALRIRVPDTTITFSDLVFGEVRENLATECGDFVVQRADGVFAYQLAVIVDDADMGITRVVRGSDLLHSSPRQIYLAKTLGLKTPEYAHTPLFVSPSGRRLSKRDRDLGIKSLREDHIPPEQILGALAYHLGFIQKAHRMSCEELIEHFSWEKLQRTVRNKNANIVVDDTFFHNIGC